MKRLAVLALAATLALPAFAALKPGAKAPQFTAPAFLAGKAFTFDLAAALKKGPVVVYFFPAAFTPGCNVEAATFSQAIDKFKALPADTLVLPSHGKPFTGLHERIGQLHDHHRDRLAEVMDFCAHTPRSAAEVLPVLFTRALDLHQTTFAMGETVAHLHTLWFAGQLARKLGDDGVYRFAALPASQHP